VDGDDALSESEPDVRRDFGIVRALAFLAALIGCSGAFRSGRPRDVGVRGIASLRAILEDGRRVGDSWCRTGLTVLGVTFVLRAASDIRPAKRTVTSLRMVVPNREAATKN
jgi:hypothetical protein